MVKRNENISITFDTIHYVDLQFTNLNTIDINIRDSQGHEF